MWSLLASLAAASPGSHPVDIVERTFQDPAVGRIPTRLYLPDAAGGPYPLAVFLHGWLGQAWMYDTVCEDLASNGFVVVSIDTQTGLILNMEAFADDAVAALYAAEAASADPADALAGLVANEPWTVLGHSMGGATLAHVLGLEPRFDTAVAFMPYEGSRSYYTELAGFDGSYLLLTGTNDTTAPPRLQAEWFDAADLTARSLWVSVTDMGHQAVTDLSFNEDPMPDDQQLQIVTDLSTDFVLAEHGGDEDRWARLLGADLAGLDTDVGSRSQVPALWAELDGDSLAAGVATLPGTTVDLVLGTAELPDGLADALVADTVTTETGVVQEALVVPADWEGDLWVRAHITGNGVDTWSRALLLAEGAVTEPDPTDPDPGTEPDPEPGTTGGDPDEEPSPAQEAKTDPAKGCSTSPVGPSWALLLALPFWRRRR